MTRTVIYYSSEWQHLVETGWVTMTVEETPGGARVAQMIYCPSRRW